MKFEKWEIVLDSTEDTYSVRNSGRGYDLAVGLLRNEAYSLCEYYNDAIESHAEELKELKIEDLKGLAGLMHQIKLRDKKISGLVGQVGKLIKAMSGMVVRDDGDIHEVDRRALAIETLVSRIKEELRDG